MPDLSPAQKKYLACVRREKYLIHVSRIFLFLGFLLLWEVSARQGWIDSFIFSSPSEIPFLVRGVNCLLNCDNGRDLCLVTECRGESGGGCQNKRGRQQEEG